MNQVPDPMETLLALDTLADAVFSSYERTERGQLRALGHAEHLVAAIVEDRDLDISCQWQPSKATAQQILLALIERGWTPPAN